MAETAVETGKRGRKAAIKAEKAAEAAEEPKPKGRSARATAETPTFWQKVAQVAKADWGPRANIYLYRVEPVIDRRRAGSQTYITKYAEPISEDRILADHGSGRYKLMLNFRKPGAEQGDEVDSLYLDLLNLQFPPKIPPGEWVDDPNNKKWAWAKASMDKSGPQQGNNLVEALDVLNEIQDSTTKRVLANLPPPTSGADEVVKIAKVLDIIRPPAPPPAAPDNSLAVFMQAELRSIREQVEKSRERELALMEKLMDAKTKPSESGGFGIVKELVGGLKELIPEVRSLFPAAEDGGFVGRSRMNGWQDFAVQMAPHFAPALTPLFHGLAARFLMPQPMNGMGHVPQPNPGQPPHPQALPPGPAAGAPPTMMPFLQSIAFPMQQYIRYMGPPESEDPTEAGKAFAEWIYNGYGANPSYGQAITAAKGMGPVGIIAAFRTTPMWMDKGPQNNLPCLAELEPQLTPFFTAFLNWDPEADDEPQETDPAQPEVLTYSGR